MQLVRFCLKSVTERKRLNDPSIFIAVINVFLYCLYYSVCLSDSIYQRDMVSVGSGVDLLTESSLSVIENKQTSK